MKELVGNGELVGTGDIVGLDDGGGDIVGLGDGDGDEEKLDDVLLADSVRPNAVAAPTKRRIKKPVR